jgi:4-alpha-glucanotransferase
MGDLPIFVAHHSADCWARPDLYELDDDFQPTVVAGVPPDDLGPLGQRWGNPLYRWDRMAAEGYAWWTRACTARCTRPMCSASTTSAALPATTRSRPAARPRTWAAGPGAGAGAVRCHLSQAGRTADRGRGPGLITPDVIELRDGCGFPGMKILQFAFGGDGDARVPAAQLRRHCVVYTGTHDNDTVRGWWAGRHAERERRLCRHLPGLHRARRALGDDPRRLQLGGQLAVVPLQDVLGLPSEHRMNTGRARMGGSQLDLALRLAHGGGRSPGPRAGPDHRRQRLRQPSGLW